MEHIEITGGGSRHNAELRRFVNDLQDIADRGRKMLAGYQKMVVFSQEGADFTGLAKSLALEDSGDPENNAEPDVVTAEAIYSLFVGVADVLVDDGDVPGPIATLLSRML